MHPINSTLTKRAKSYLLADFFWNTGRTLPHAILTVFLLSMGLTLQQLALLQIIYMVTVMACEFPSGLLCDRYSRKVIYATAIFLIAISYAIIGFGKGDFTLLCFAYLLYGASSALKSGSIENDVVLEYREHKQDLQYFSSCTTIMISASSIVGALVGSLLYYRIGYKIYYVAIAFFAACELVTLKFQRFHPKAAETNAKTVSFSSLRTDFLSAIRLFPQMGKPSPLW